MKKYILTIIIFLIGIGSSIILFQPNQEIKENEKENNSSFISMMVEDEEGKYIEKNENQLVKDGYIFNPEKSGCENEGTLVWNNEKQKIEASLLTSDKCYAYFDKYDFTKSCLFGYEDNLSCDLIKNKDNTLIYHDGKCDYEEEANCDLEAGDNNYRYAGADEEVDNYVCFGSDVEPCPEDNLYRIIGIFDGNTKLIKADYTSKDYTGNTGEYFKEYSDRENYLGNKENLNKIASYYWNNANGSDSKNIWKESKLNTENLNNVFLNTFSISQQKCIKLNNWFVGGVLDAYVKSSNAKDVYVRELGKEKKSNEQYPAKIGLIYLSDYYYAINSAYWNCPGNSYETNDYGTYKEYNWMYMGLWEWTITRGYEYSDRSAFISHEGKVDVWGHFVYSNAYAIRPTFYLEKNIEAISGDGTKLKPYYIRLSE